MSTENGERDYTHIHTLFLVVGFYDFPLSD